MKTNSCLFNLIHGIIFSFGSAFDWGGVFAAVRFFFGVFH